MPITINGNGTIGGITAGGLPNGTVTRDDLATTAKGSILQVVSINNSTPNNLASTNFQSWSALAATAATIYPKASNSHLLYVCGLNLEHDAPSTSNIYGFLSLYKDIGDGSSYQSISNSYQYMSESSDSHGSTTATSFIYTDTNHGVTVGNPVSYKVYYNRANNTSSTHFNQVLTVPADGGAQTSFFSNGYIMEIAQ